MSVVVTVIVTVIVIRVGIDLLFSNKQKSHKQRIMNHEDYAPPPPFRVPPSYYPGKAKKNNPQKKVKYTHP